MNNLGTRFGDITKIPKGLMRQIHIKTDEPDAKAKAIIKSINELLDGYGNIDEILVAYYRKYSEELDRTYLANKLYRMVRDGYLLPIKGKKGAYKVKE